MKRKNLALLLCAALLLTACTAAPPADPTAPTYAQNAEIYGDSVRVGKFRADVPAGFRISDISDEDSIYLVSDNELCAIALVALDVSDLEEGKIATVIANERPTDPNAEFMDTAFSDMDLKGYLWVDFDEDLDATVTVQTTFTDSWYLYQITTRMYPGHEATDVMGESIAFLMSFAADEVPSRFDFVQ